MPAIGKKVAKIIALFLTLYLCFLYLKRWPNVEVQIRSLVRVVDSNLDRTEVHRRFEQWRKFTEGSSLNKTSFGIVLAEKDRELLLNILKYFTSVCEQHNITYFITGGTLLGSWRHHGFIPWDDDIDIYMDFNDKDRFRRLFNVGTNEFYALLAYRRMKIFSENGTNTSNHPWLWPYVDVTFYLQNRTHIWGEPGDFANELYWKRDVFPLHLRPFENLYVNSPHDGFAFLRQTFNNLNCETYFYSHKFESAKKDRIRSVRCSTFKNDLAFVYRHRITGGSGIQETLIIGNKTIHSLVVKEPQYAITKPFSLHLKRIGKSAGNSTERNRTST